MFNQLGKPIKTMGQKDMAYLNFLGEELYYISGKEIVLVDLYTNEKRTLPKPEDCKFVLLTDERKYVVDIRSVSISEFKPD